jgi:hypothetical protein
MSIKDEIQKPIVKIIPIEGSGDGLPANCYFQVEINFKEINGVLPYPCLIYPSKPRPIDSAQNSPDALMAALADKIQNHKQYCDFLKEKQALVDSFLNSAWGE